MLWKRAGAMSKLQRVTSSARPTASLRGRVSVSLVGPFRVAVSGEDITWQDRGAVHLQLERFRRQQLVLVDTGRRGAAYIARIWAADHRVPIERLPVLDRLVLGDYIDVQRNKDTLMVADLVLLWGHDYLTENLRRQAAAKGHRNVRECG